MPETKRPLKVFLCHASADKPKVRELYRYLRRRGIKPWFDEMDLIGGQDWQVEIPKAIATSDAIIVCLTKNSVDKEGYVQKEIRFALDKALEMPEGRIYLIPVRFEECEVPFSLSRYQWVDLFDKIGFTRLMKSLKTRAGQLERAAVEVPKPDEFSPNLASTSENNISDRGESNIQDSTIIVGDKNIVQPASEDNKKKEQEFELKKLESQAIQYELIGDFRNARKTWYEIKQINPLFPRVDIKIEELEREVAENAARERAKAEKAQKEESEFAERAMREKTKRDAAEKSKRERAERQAAQIVALKETLSKSFASLKSTLPKAIPFLRATGIIGILIVLFWIGSWGIPKLASLVPTARASLTPTLRSSATPAFTLTVTKTSTPSLTSSKTITPVLSTPTDYRSPTIYVLQPGEFVYCIARRFNVDPDELFALNGISDSQTIYPGLALRIPQNGNPFPGNRSIRAHPAKYTVTASDETIYSVACAFSDVFPEDIASTNSLPINSTLSVGQALQIP